jgi:serine/threonine-protein kinase
VLADPAEKLTLEKRFKREIETTQALDHPNIVKVLHSGNTPDGGLYVALEFLAGQELRDLMYDQGRLSPVRVARIGAQIARALASAHGRGVVHRDLKPENIFVIAGSGESDKIKVVDFGIARLIAPEAKDITKLTRAGTAVGTPRYMAPEQGLAQEITPQTDLYALGIMLYEMLSGDAPFDGPTEMMTALMQIQEPPPPLTVPGLDARRLAQWQALISQLLEKDPRQRPADGAWVAAELERIEPAASAAPGASAAAAASGGLQRVTQAPPPASGGGDKVWMIVGILAGLIGVGLVVFALLAGT